MKFPATVLAACTLGLALASAHAARSAADPRLLGCWEGKGRQSPTSGMVHWQVERTADHRYKVQFTIEDDDGSSWAYIEEGTWAFKGVRYQTRVTHIEGTAVDPQDPGYSHVYYMRSLTAEAMTYYSPEADVEFQARKAICKVEPRCEQGCTAA